MYIFASLSQKICTSSCNDPAFARESCSSRSSLEVFLGGTPKNEAHPNSRRWKTRWMRQPSLGQASFPLSLTWYAAETVRVYATVRKRYREREPYKSCGRNFPACFYCSLFLSRLLLRTSLALRYDRGERKTSSDHQAGE